MPERPSEPRDLVAEILGETIDRLAQQDEFDSTMRSRISAMLQAGLPKQGRDLKSLLTENHHHP